MPKLSLSVYLRHWRPKNWWSRYSTDQGWAFWSAAAFEFGASAMLEALKEKGLLKPETDKEWYRETVREWCR